ncbi:acid phosphatase [Dyella thiooxydans]|uniref:Acid phosphatase n=1 Tax=Dyella thiooxydans TaxID=445710 RepID=A0A160N3Y1_9GAMM|nr:alkaline phosphatase family protein [Dyella thiooxydans]AND70600.1 acid phosphatase [Dyella thiooxydans]
MKRSLLPMALMLALTACHHDTPSATGKVHVTLDGVVGGAVPVAGVPVTVTDHAGQHTVSAVTDARGHYSLVVEGSGPFVLTAPAAGGDGAPVTWSAAFVPTAGQMQAVANINPVTALVTQRALGVVPQGAPATAQMVGLTDARVATAAKEVAGVLAPLYAAFQVPAAQAVDPAVAADFQAGADTPLARLLSVVHFDLPEGAVSVGSDADRAVVSIPAHGTLSAAVPTTAATSALALANGPTTTPIQHVIVVIGENQTFDGLFGGYAPPKGQTVNNLLSEGIINADGTPGPNFALAAQSQAKPQTGYTLQPERAGAYATLPQPQQIGEMNPVTFQAAGGLPDKRFPADLPNGPFQITRYVPYINAGKSGLDAAVRTGDPVHRFFQMWQQTGGDNHKLDMFTWVADSTGQGGDTKGVSPANPSQGGELMGFMNMSAGDAPLFDALAKQYALSDNYHQSIMGGTGDNFFAIATADVPFFNRDGKPVMPPANQIENPEPMPGTDNFYTRDGYEGGSYVNCADPKQPGVAPILAFLAERHVPSKCAPDTYYLVNNYNPGYDMDGKPQPIGPDNYNYPPQTVPTIAEALAKKGVSWKWYTGGRDAADVAAEAAAYHVSVAKAQMLQYNNIGDPLAASSKVMGDPALKSGLAGLATFDADIAHHTLPAVSFVVPKNLDSGHPGYSAPASYEAFLKDLLAKVQADPQLWAHTAVLITTDEGGGHFDTGYIQSVDFFGDGPRISMLAVSPYARKGVVDHAYQDHASILKFIERNWRLSPLSARSRDNLPNPVVTPAKPYQPINGPAVGDLMSMFQF